MALLERIDRTSVLCSRRRRLTREFRLEFARLFLQSRLVRCTLDFESPLHVEFYTRERFFVFARKNLQFGDVRSLKLGHRRFARLSRGAYGSFEFSSFLLQLAVVLSLLSAQR